MATHIHGLGTAVPPYRHSQDEMLQFMLRKLPLDAATADRLARLYARSGIESRHLVLPDFGAKATGSGPFAGDEVPSQRMAIYRSQVVPRGGQSRTRSASPGDTRFGT